MKRIWIIASPKRLYTVGVYMQRGRRLRPIGYMALKLRDDDDERSYIFLAVLLFIFLLDFEFLFSSFYIYSILLTHRMGVILFACFLYSHTHTRAREQRSILHHVYTVTFIRREMSKRKRE